MFAVQEHGTFGTGLAGSVSHIFRSRTQGSVALPQRELAFCFGTLTCSHYGIFRVGAPLY